MTDKNNAGINLDREQVLELMIKHDMLSQIGYRALLNGDSLDADLNYLTQLVNLARRAEPSVTAATDGLRRALQAMLDGAWTPDVIAQARAALASPAVSQKDGAAVDPVTTQTIFAGAREDIPDGYFNSAATTASASERKKFDDHFGEGSWEACEKADAARRATAPSRDATGLPDDLRRSESGALIVDYHTEQAIRAALARAPLPDSQEAVLKFAIEVEKMLCAALGREWATSGISIESLIKELAGRAPLPAKGNAKPVAKVIQGTEWGPGLAFIADGQDSPKVGTLLYAAAPAQAGDARDTARSYIDWWTSIETDVRKSMLVFAHREPERLHALVKQAYEEGQQSVRAAMSASKDKTPEAE